MLFKKPSSQNKLRVRTIIKAEERLQTIYLHFLLLVECCVATLFSFYHMALFFLGN